MAEEQPIKVSDRRTSQGAGETPSEPAGQPESVDEGKEPGEAEMAGMLKDPTFSDIILTFYSQALIHLGVSPSPVTGKAERKLPLAKYFIDILGILKEKSKGNLAKDEDAFLSEIVTHLRMQYVEATKN